MSRTQEQEYWGGAAYEAAGSDHYVHPRYATAIRVEGTTGEDTILPKGSDLRGAERFWIFNEGPNAAAIVDYEGASVTSVASGSACLIWPDGDGGWVVGSTYTVQYP